MKRRSFDCRFPWKDWLLSRNINRIDLKWFRIVGSDYWLNHLIDRLVHCLLLQQLLLLLLLLLLFLSFSPTIHSFSLSPLPFIHWFQTIKIDNNIPCQQKKKWNQWKQRIKCFLYDNQWSINLWMNDWWRKTEWMNE